MRKSSSKRKARQDAAKRVAATVASVLTDPLSGGDRTWLQHLHDTYSQRFQADNEKIWTSGAILVPLSLAPFVGQALTNGAVLPTAVLAGISMTLYVFWMLTAQRFREYCERSLMWTAAIEQAIGLAEVHQIMREYECQYVPKWRRVHSLRWILGAAIFVGWVVTYL